MMSLKCVMYPYPMSKAGGAAARLMGVVTDPKAKHRPAPLK